MEWLDIINTFVSILSLLVSIVSLAQIQKIRVNLTGNIETKRHNNSLRSRSLIFGKDNKIETKINK